MDYISIRDAAERVGVSHKVIRRLIAQGIVVASKFHGAHGAEWRVERGSLDAYAAARRVPQPVTQVRLRVAPGGPSEAAACDGTTLSAEVEQLRSDKRFLERQVETLTSLLSASLSGSRAPLPSVEAGSPAATADVTQALQSSLRSLGVDQVRSFEFCSIRVLWGKPVLWRVVADDPVDVASLAEAILAPAAAWVPPGEETVFVWAVDAAGSVLWGTACGPGWFGPEFQSVLSGCRIERR